MVTSALSPDKQNVSSSIHSMAFSRICQEGPPVCFHSNLLEGSTWLFTFAFPLVLHWLPWPFCTAGAWHIHSGVLAKATSRECSQCCQLKVFPALCRRGKAHQIQEAQKILTCGSICMAYTGLLCPHYIYLAVTLRLSCDTCICIFFKWNGENLLFLSNVLMFLFLCDVVY